MCNDISPAPQVVGAFTTDGDAAASLGQPPRPKLVGIARAISDGQFVALISDVAVSPLWQVRPAHPLHSGERDMRSIIIFAL